MPGYYLYLPGKHAHNPAHLDSVGLAGLVGKDGGPMMADVSHGGPDGGTGVLAAWDERLSIRPTQDWTPVDGGRYWLGREQGEPITPGMLARSKQHAGQDVLLDDGHAWHVPVARQLPQCFTLEGLSVKPAYKPYWDAAYKALDTWLVVDEVEAPRWAIPWEAGFAFAAQALEMNYRVNADILRWLGIVGTDHLVPLVEAATEGWLVAHVLAALQKKRDLAASGGEPTPAGEAA